MELKFRTFSSSQQLVDFINNNRLTKDTIQKIEKISYGYELFYWDSVISNNKASNTITLSKEY